MVHHVINQNTYIKMNDNKLINEACIRWVKKMDQCLEICIKSNGCGLYINGLRDTHLLCRDSNPSDFDKLNKFFEVSNEHD